MDFKKARAAYQRHKWDANKRGIEMTFTFYFWCQWWEKNLGPDWQSLRGRKQDQYVMARFRDEGPYAPWNVRCITVADNHIEHNLLRKTPRGPQRSRIEARKVAAIFKADGLYADIAERYGVGSHQVHCIKTKKYYRSITDHL